jgi:hypothetical protein
MDTTKPIEPAAPMQPALGAAAGERLDAVLAEFDRRYEQRPVATTILMTDFFMGYLRELYQAFDGDIPMALVLGEVGQATTRRFTESSRHDALPIESADAGAFPGAARPCNALSASLASGVPRETARRKVRELAERGWIAPMDGGWVATAAAGARFQPTFNREQARRLLETARLLVEVLVRE